MVRLALISLDHLAIDVLAVRVIGRAQILLDGDQGCGRRIRRISLFAGLDSPDLLPNPRKILSRTFHHRHRDDFGRLIRMQFLDSIAKR
jgi:hypothetical protein